MASDSTVQLSQLTGARQTMLSWAKVIESWEAVPEVYRNSFSMVVAEGSSLPYTVFAPSIVGWGRKTTEKLLCEVSDTIYVWECVGDKVAMAAYPLRTISDLEVGIILLYSWITIGGVTQAGTASSSTIEYDTAIARHFAPFVNRMRPAPRDMDEREQGVELAKLNQLAAASFKFGAYALESLVGGDEIHQALWQPQIRKPVVKLGGRVLFQTTVSLQHVAILTDRELIVIQDDARCRENRGIRYGGKWQYVALSHISGVSLLERAEDLLVLSLTLCPGGRQLEIIFAASRKQAVAQLQHELEKLIG